MYHASIDTFWVSHVPLITVEHSDPLFWHKLFFTDWTRHLSGIFGRILIWIWRNSWGLRRGVSSSTLCVLICRYLVTNSSINAFKGTAAHRADKTTTSSLDLPIFLFLLVCVHPTETTAGETEDCKNHWLDKDTCENVAIAYDNIVSCLSVEGQALGVMPATDRAVLEENCGAPHTQDQ